jgi:hypothetical protein
MLKAIRRRITPSMLIATLALVFAMTGGAYAAKKYLITSTKQISPKVLKSLKGASGQNGPAGPAGPAGAAGAGSAGAAGPQGPAGAAGAKGENGAPGAPGAKGEPGAKGLTGATGSPWTAGGTLPGGKTETGAWAFGEVAAGAVPVGFAPLRIPISFSIPLSSPSLLGSTDVHYINAAGKEVTTFGTVEVTSTACLGSATNPTAEPGNLCVYTGSLVEAKGTSEFIETLDGGGAGASTAGANIMFFNIKAEASGFGSWAVTEEE